jgi:anti-sigma B factor antagonist
MQASPEFRVERVPCDREGVTVLAVSGDIDMTASREFGRRLESGVRAASGDVVLDLVRVRHLDSTALRALLRGRQVAEERGALLVIACGRRVQHVLEVTGLEQVFDIHPERELALEAIGRDTQPKR